MRNLGKPDDIFSSLGRNRMEFRTEALIIADALGFAAQHGMAFQDVLRAIPFYRRKRLFSAWQARIDALIEGLDAGWPLSVAIRAHCSRTMPEFYIVGVERAEADGRLTTALPVLAAQMKVRSAVAIDRLADILPVAIRLLAAAGIIVLLVRKILPAFEEIFESLVVSDGAWRIRDDLHALVNISWMFGAIAAAVGITLFIIYLIGRRKNGLSAWMGFPGRELLQYRQLDLAHSMAAFLRQGDDIVTAAEWSARTTGSLFLKQQLEQFIADVRGGIRWDKAWARISVDPMASWIVANAAARENPADGFSMLAQWTEQRLWRSTRLISVFVDPACTLVIGAIIGYVCIRLIHILTTICLKLS